MNEHTYLAENTTLIIRQFERKDTKEIVQMRWELKDGRGNYIVSVKREGKPIESHDFYGSEGATNAYVYYKNKVKDGWGYDNGRI